MTKEQYISKIDQYWKAIEKAKGDRDEYYEKCDELRNISQTSTDEASVRAENSIQQGNTEYQNFSDGFVYGDATSNDKEETDKQDTSNDGNNNAQNVDNSTNGYRATQDTNTPTDAVSGATSSGNVNANVGRGAGDKITQNDIVQDSK